MAISLQKPVIEMRWHGRGGQGVVTASRLLAEAALEEGLYFQTTPDFGAERSGAPIMAYSRFANEPISNRSNVTEPDVIIVFDPTLIGRVNFLNGVKDETIVVLNTTQSPKEIVEKLKLQGQTVCTVDATGIAMKLLGRNIPNVPIIGAIIKALPVVSYERAHETVKNRLSQRFNERIVKANLDALQQGYQESQLGGV